MNTPTFTHKPSLRVGDRVRIDPESDHPQAGSEGILKLLYLGDPIDAVIDLGEEFLVEVDRWLLDKIQG